MIIWLLLKVGRNYIIQIIHEALKLFIQLAHRIWQWIHVAGDQHGSCMVVSIAWLVKGTPGCSHGQVISPTGWVPHGDDWWPAPHGWPHLTAIVATASLDQVLHVPFTTIPKWCGPQVRRAKGGGSCEIMTLGRSITISACSFTTKFPPFWAFHHCGSLALPWIGSKLGYHMAQLFCWWNRCYFGQTLGVHSVPMMHSFTCGYSLNHVMKSMRVDLKTWPLMLQETRWEHGRSHKNNNYLCNHQWMITFGSRNHGDQVVTSHEPMMCVNQTDVHPLAIKCNQAVLLHSLLQNGGPFPIRKLSNYKGCIIQLAIFTGGRLIIINDH